MIATHIVKLVYFVSEENKSIDSVRADALARGKMMFGDALENVEVEEL